MSLMITVRSKLDSIHSSEADNRIPVLSSDDASLIALELGRNPVVDDEAAFDLYPA
jgi:translation initiation factor IF-2